MQSSTGTIGIGRPGATLYRVFPPTAWTIAIVAALLILPGRAEAEPRNEYLSFSIQSPGPREVAVPDTATMEEVLEILRANDIPVDGPRPILVEDGAGGQVVAGYNLTVDVTTAISGTADEAHCPYRQITEMLYGLNGRLLEYKVSYDLNCIQ